MDQQTIEIVNFSSTALQVDINSSIVYIQWSLMNNKTLFFRLTAILDIAGPRNIVHGTVGLGPFQ